jgi:hypothetical protein
MDVWVPVIVAVIAALPPTLVAYAALHKAREVKDDIEAVHMEVNSRLSQLLTLTGKSSHAEGVKQERDRKGNDGNPGT